MSAPRGDQKRPWRGWVADLFSGEPSDRFDFQVLHADSRRIRLLQLHCR